jgi:hypothetical protein
MQVRILLRPQTVFLIKQLTTMLEIKNQKTKTTACRENGRSADFTSGNFILGCSQKKEILMIIPCSYCM